MAILNFQCPGATHVTSPTRISPYSDTTIPLPQEVSDSHTNFLGTVAAPAGTLWSAWLEDVHRLAPHLSSSQVMDKLILFLTSNSGNIRGAAPRPCV